MTREEVAMICKAMSYANRLRIIESLTQDEKCGYFFNALQYFKRMKES